MAAPAELDEPISVALIGRDDEARSQLRQALAALGADIVAEKEPSAIDGDALMAAAPQVVIVNLDDAIEDDLDHLQPLFDRPGVNVVFNEAETTRQLSGWDLARWARHLAVKVLGHGDPNPPAPAGRELLPTLSLVPSPGAPPTPADLAGERFIEEFTIEAEDHADAVPTDYMPMTEPEAAIEPDAAGFDIDASAIESALDEAERPRPEVSAASVPDAQPGEDDAALPEIDLSMLDAALSGGFDEPAQADDPVAEPSVDAVRADATDAGGAADPDFDAGDAASDDAAVLDAALADFNLDDDAPPRRFSEFEADGDSLDLGEDADVAALSAQLDALSAPGEAMPADTGHDDLDALLRGAGDDAADDDESASLAAAPAPVAAPAPDLDPAGPGFGDLSLEAMTEDEGSAPAAPAAAAPAATTPGFDLSGLSLEPIDEDGEAAATAQPATPAAAAGAKAAFDFDAMGLSLEPLEGEEQEAPAPVAEGELPRVVVLGASIGGPDALRTFLAGIPDGFPALFLLAQHLESGFFERLAQQLQKASKLPVKVAEAGTRASVGEVLVVPSEHRLVVAPDGAVEQAGREEPPRYKPCIDEVLRDVADRFGRRATAIIFSGMAGDAVEGAVYLTSKGGEVWAQDSESCVVSSMVDGARSRGVVEFSGSPRELAERLVAKFG